MLLNKFNIFVAMIRIVILGGGHVAHHLSKAFATAKTVSLVQVYARKMEQIETLQSITSITNKLSEIKDADVYVIAITDDAIPQLSKQLNLENAFVVHTSGSASLEALQHQGRKGVFYPLQSFTKDKTVSFENIPLCIEAQYSDDLVLLDRLAGSLSKQVYTLNSKQRKSLHVAAVFVNNFSNHMYTLGHDICKAYDIPFEILFPLIKETAQKVTTITPKEAQTGPAQRNDEQTIAAHIDLLTAQQQIIYQLITKSIQEHGKKL